MPLEDIPQDQQLPDVKWGGERSVTTATPASPTNTNNWYIGAGLGERDVFVNASRAADVSGETQQVHHHPAGASCQGLSHSFVHPDEKRSVAVGLMEREARRIEEARRRLEGFDEK